MDKERNLCEEESEQPFKKSTREEVFYFSVCYHGQVTRSSPSNGEQEKRSSLLQMGLIDELRIMVNPIVLGSGKSIFNGIHDKLNLKLLKTRTFRSGNVLHHYQPITKENL